MTPMARSIVLGTAVGSSVGLIWMFLLALVPSTSGWDRVVLLVYGMFGLVVTGAAVGALVGWLSGRGRNSG